MSSRACARLCGKSRPTDGGFTLIELLVVVIIIGILAAIAIPTFLSMRERGWQAQLTSDVRNAILDIEASAVLNGGFYPGASPVFMTSDPAITLDYLINAAGDVFCVEGTDTRLSLTPQVAHYSNGSGVQIFEACPAGLAPPP